MPDYMESRLYGHAFARGGNPGAHDHLIRLKSALANARRRVIPLLTLIPRDVPELTVHDISHVDALWHVADMTAGANYDLTPVEAFVLGVAFLIHDAGISLAAYRGGIAELQATSEWEDARASLEAEFGFARNTAEETDDRLFKILIARSLRLRHARQAEGLATMCWHSPEGDEAPLIEDEDLRKFYGPLIGVIAHSHHWEVERLSRDLPAKHGALPGFPSTWTLDPLKVACLLRVADAAHISAERAPHFHRTVLRPHGISDDHWNFQSRLFQPTVGAGDTLIFRSRPFGLSDVQAWWLAYRTLRSLDHEIKQVNDLLLDTTTIHTPRPPLAVRRVAGADSAERLAELLPTVDWWPVDTSIRIPDPTAIVQALGGQQLYGDRPWVILRELLQNAVDAIHARRNIDPEWTDDDGAIEVSLAEDEGGWYLTVADDGLGMSRRMLTKGLLSFGKSYWRSADIGEEHPGLLSTAFDPIGRFGIGFFSVFMLSDRVLVTTRRFDERPEKAWTLEFFAGLKLPAMLRIPQQFEVPYRRSTAIKVRLSKIRAFALGMGEVPPWDISSQGFLNTFLAQAVMYIAPALDVGIRISEPAGTTCIPANLWLASPEHVFRRIVNCKDDAAWGSLSGALACDAPRRERLIQQAETEFEYTCVRAEGAAEKLVGRAAIYSRRGQGAGFHIVRGFRGESSSRFSGFMPGEVEVASRLSTRLALKRSEAQFWIDEQALRLQKARSDGRLSSESASTLTTICDSYYRMGCDLGAVPFLQSDKGLLTVDEFIERFSGLRSASLMPFTMPRKKRRRDLIIYGEALQDIPNWIHGRERWNLVDGEEAEKPLDPLSINARNLLYAGIAGDIVGKLSRRFSVLHSKYRQLDKTAHGYDYEFLIRLP